MSRKQNVAVIRLIQDVDHYGGGIEFVRVFSEKVYGIGEVSQANSGPARRAPSETASIVVVAEQRQVNRVGHGPVAGIVGMSVIAAVIRRQNARRVARISQHLV